MVVFFTRQKKLQENTPKSPITGEWVNILLYIIRIIYQTAIKTIKFCCGISHAATQEHFRDNAGRGKSSH